MTNLPLNGTLGVTATYGQTGSLWPYAGGHKGIDLVTTDKSLKVYSTCDGVVRVATNDPGGWGNYVSIGDAERPEIRHIFAHLASINVKVGQKVDRATVIGIMGATGNVTGKHLHYEMRDTTGGEHTVDPTVWMGIPNKVGSYLCTDYPAKSWDQILGNDDGGSHDKGEKLSLNKAPLYASATAKSSASAVSGTYYLYDGKEVSGRYRITNSPERVGKEPIGSNVTGWVDKENI